jgi:hypothetical protein
VKLVRTWYVDPKTAKQVVLEKEDDGLVSPPTITLHEPLVGPVSYIYQATEWTSTDEEEQGE